jgi:mRNA-degrading endonuclease RelE of RelBE toxin-antitoxin system
MYDIRPKSNRCKKDLKKLLSGLSSTVRQRINLTLRTNPYPTQTHGQLLNKITRKGVLYCYPVSGGSRILFDIYEEEKVVMIHFAGNDDDQIKYLQKFSK